MAKIRSFGITVTVDATAIGGLTDVSPGGGDVTFVDTTTHDTDGGWKTYVGGLKDGGTLELTGKYDIADAGQVKLRTLLGETESCVVTFSDGSSAEFDGIVGAYNVSNPLDDATEFTSSIKITGEVVYAAGA
jgi:predicted secreted protein